MLSESEYQSFWETESFGTEVQHSKSRSTEDQRNQDILEKRTEFKEGHCRCYALDQKGIYTKVIG